MHGSVDRETKKWDSYVITEEDYVDFLARMTGQTAIPARLMLEFRKRRFLFVGYGLRDWNLRVMLRHLKSALATTETSATEATGEHEDLRSWAIQRHPTELERALWLARKVNIYDMDIDCFAAKLRERMALGSAAGTCQ